MNTHLHPNDMKDFHVMNRYMVLLDKFLHAFFDRYLLISSKQSSFPIRYSLLEWTIQKNNKRYTYIRHIDMHDFHAMN